MHSSPAPADGLDLRLGPGFGLGLGLGFSDTGFLNALKSQVFLQAALRNLTFTRIRGIMKAC